MRVAGVVDESEGYGPHDHLCWAYDTFDEFEAAVASFLAEGLALGQRVAYVGIGSADDLRSQLTDLEPLDELVASGTVQLVALAERYRPGNEGTAADQADAYAQATADALRAGFTGLRVAAEATPLVLDADRRRRFVQYEHVVDRLMAAGLAFSALCGYDRSILGPDAVDELAAVHPVVRGASVPFRIFAGHTGELVLAGEVDAFHADALARTLAATLPAGAATASVDCTGLAFADHRALLALDRCASQAGVELRLLHPAPIVDRLRELLELQAVTVSLA